MRRNDQFSDSQKVYQMCTPHPKPLLQGRRSLVRHGTLDYFSPNTISRKPRYFFLFSDCLLLTKRTGTQKFWLKIYIHLGPNIHIIPMWDSPDFEFRLLIDEKGTLAKRKQRRLILYGQNKSHKEAWLNDLLHCLWDSTGRKGADPSIRDDKKELKSPRGKKEEGDKWSCSNCTYLNKPGTSHCDMCGGAKFGGDVEEYDSSDDEEKRKRRENKHKKDRQQGGGQHADNYSDNSNPLLLFDPFSDPKGPDASFDPSQHRGIDQYGQAVPKGVMLEGDNPYGSGAGPYGAGGGYGTGAPGPYGSGAGGYDPSQGAYGAGGAYGSGASPYGAGAESAGLAGTAYAGGASPYGYGGVAASPYGYGTDPSGLYDAARNASSALGGMFATAPGSGGGAAGGAGLAGAGLGGAGGFGAGVATTSPPHSSGSGGSPASSQRDDNLDDLAQKELLEATRVIEQLAAQLASRPRKAPPRTAETEHLEITTEEISDAILDGAQAIARAASALMRAASLAQEERVKLNTQRASGDATYHADPVWANGLISAARNVVATTQYLVSTANSASNGQAGEETLVASARAVGAATAHLVAAQKAKGDVNSQASRELDDAARGIARATASLVEAAKLASTPAPAPAPAAAAVPDKYTMTDKQIREIEAQTRLLQLEKETQRAREELLKMRKQEYRG